MFAISVCLYEEMTKRFQNMIYLENHFGKTVVDV